MTSDSHFSRASLLMGQARYELAEAELRKQLAQDPQDDTAHALLAICLSEREKFEDALTEAGMAIALAPDDPFPHYALARVNIDRECWRDAEKSIREAIRLDPYDETNFSTLAIIMTGRGKWQAVLEAADEGLALNPEHTDCINMRALALRRLGKDDTAGEALELAMQEDPEDAWTHCNMGWWCMEQGDQERAVVHFREALRLNPEMDSAREGMLDVLRSENVIYHGMLKFAFWLSKQSTRSQWGIIILAVLIYVAMGRWADAMPAWAIWIEMARLTLMGCFWLTWMGEPLFNLLLRMNPEGRRFLSENDIQMTNWCAIFAVPAVIFFFLALIFGHHTFRLSAAMLALMVLPVKEVFESRRPWVRKWMAVYAAIVVAMGFTAVLSLFYWRLFGWVGALFVLTLNRPLLFGSLLGAAFADNFSKWLKRQEPGR